MAEFLGILKGARGAVTRLGHKSTGINSELCSWDGKLVSQLYHQDGEIWVRVWLDRHEGHGRVRLLIEQTLSSLQEKGILPLDTH